MGFTSKGAFESEEEYERAINQQKRIYITYTKKHKISGEIYTGRTSGFGDPEEIIRKRDACHHMDLHDLMTDAKIDVYSTNYAAIRGREEIMIQRHGGPQHFGGTSGNYRSGVGDNNKQKGYYIRTAQKEFD